MIGIYKITNKKTGQSYIGQSNNCERRILEHQQKRILTIDDWINALGKEAFQYEIIEECPQELLDEREQYYIQKFNSIENGYNIQYGGYNNSIGSGNGRALLNENDVIEIRKAYQNHKSPKEEYEKYKDKISFSHFQGVWQGKSWTHIMPEVFTPENKEYYRSGMAKETANLKPEEVLEYRKYYVTHTAEETYNFMLSEKGQDFPLKKNSFKKILQGDVKENSIYKDVPVYKKKTKEWIKK